MIPCTVNIIFIYIISTDIEKYIYKCSMEQITLHFIAGNSFRKVLFQNQKIFKDK